MDRRRSQRASTAHRHPGPPAPRAALAAPGILAIPALALSAAVAVAGVPPGPPRVSPLATASQVVGVSEVSVVYSRPAVAGRAVWGAEVPYGDVWRTGANEATRITFSDDVRIDGEPLAAGSYALFTIPGEESWTVIFNRDAEQWGASRHDPAADALRIDVKPRRAPFRERFAIGFPDVGIDSTAVSLRWEEIELLFDIQFDVREATLERAREFVLHASPDQGQMVWNWAHYCYQNRLALGEALEWARELAESSPMYWTLALEARLLAANGHPQEAAAAAERALARVGTEAGQPGIEDDAALLTAELTDWRSGR